MCLNLIIFDHWLPKFDHFWAKFGHFWPFLPKFDNFWRKFDYFFRYFLLVYQFCKIWFFCFWTGGPVPHVRGGREQPRRRRHHSRQPAGTQRVRHPRGRRRKSRRIPGRSVQLLITTSNVNITNYIIINIFIL